MFFRFKNLIIASIAALMIMLALGPISTATAGQLPKSVEVCESKLHVLGDGPVAVFTGNWNGLPQTLMIPAASGLLTGKVEDNVVVLAATPAKPEWGMPKAECTMYVGNFDGKTFLVKLGQRQDETVKYRRDTERQLTGSLKGNGISNGAVMTRTQ